MDSAIKPAGDPAAERLARLNALRTEFLRYIVVGGLAFLVDAGTLFLLTALARVPYLVSAAAGFLLGLVANYVLSRRWVFRNRTLSNTAMEFTVFTLIGLVGLGLNEVLIWAFTDKVGMHYLLSKCFAAGFVLVWTFGARRWALFSGTRAGTRRARMPVPVEFAAAFAVYFVLTVVQQWAGGAYRYPMMQYPDESAHYVTGVMVHDFLLHPTMRPMEFARQFYVHYPRVSLMHWPPMMYIVEGTWMVPFGAGTASALALIAALAAALALLLHLQAARQLGRPFGWMAGLLFLSLGITREQAGMIMTEMLLALLALAACLALAAFLRTDRLRYSLIFGLFASLMILTRGDGWCLALVPPLAVLLWGRPEVLRNPRLWAAALVTVPICLPYTLLTYRVAAVGWRDQAFSWAFVGEALPESGTVLLHAFGVAGLALLGFGIAWYGFGRRTRNVRPDPLWPVLVSLMISVLLFENVVPAGIEPRKLFALVPAAVLLIVAAAALLGSRVWRTRAAAAALAILVAAGAASGFQVLNREPRDPSAMHELARTLAARPDLKNAALLVSAGAWEGVFIGEMAALDDRPAHYVLRATKHLITECNDYTLRCPAKYVTPDPLLKFLDDVPVSAVVLEPDQPMWPAEVSLLSALNSAPQTWRAERIPTHGRPAWLYTRREHMAWRSPTVDVKLSSKLDMLAW